MQFVSLLWNDDFSLIHFPDVSVDGHDAESILESSSAYSCMHCSVLYS